MAKRLTKRTATEAPKPLPARGKEEEPETYLCKDPETAKMDSGSLLGKCTGCSLNNSNSEIDHLCVTCHKLAEGLVFDTEQNRFIKKTKGRK